MRRLSGAGSHSEVRAAAHVQQSSLGSMLTGSVLRSPLVAVTAALSTGTSCHGRSPFSASSCTCSCSSSCSPVSMSRTSSLRSHSRTRRSPSVASSREESHEGASRWLRRSHSPSRTSSRGGSASPGGGKHYSCSCSPSQS